MRQELTSGDWHTIAVADGDRGWHRQGAFVGPLPPDQIALLAELRKNWVPLLGAEAETLEPAPAERCDGHLHPACLVRDARGRERRLCFDPGTGRLAHIRAESDGVSVAYAYRDWRPIGRGLLWPHAVEVTIDGAVVKRITTRTLELDPDLPDACFRAP